MVCWHSPKLKGTHDGPGIFLASDAINNCGDCLTLFLVLDLMTAYPMKHRLPDFGMHINLHFEQLTIISLQGYRESI